MIQFNLLPDVKLEYMKAARTKRLVVAIASVATVISIGILIVLLLVVLVFQKKYMNDLGGDITKYSNDLSATTDLDKILTVQNQLNSLTTLHESKPDTTRIFTFVEDVTPADVSIANLTIDFDVKTIVITGSAETLADVNTFIDTLKFTDVTQNDTKQKAFSNVVLASFGRADQGASYTINLTFDPVIFDNTADVKLTIPERITTRSETEKPGALFEPVTGTREE